MHCEDQVGGEGPRRSRPGNQFDLRLILEWKCDVDGRVINLLVVLLDLEIR